jgi:4-aminobutyrate aminotransferase/(S)-3-amino-2-methylpropionate transaminase
VLVYKPFSNEFYSFRNVYLDSFFSEDKMLKDELPKIVSKELPGPKAQAIIKRRLAVVPNAIRCVYPCVIDKAAGAMIQDVDGNYFLDWVGGVGVLNVGHCHPELVAAV